MKLLSEYIVVRVTDVMNDTTKFKGMNGRQIIMSTMFNPERHVRCHGEVISVPARLPDSPLYSKPLGTPGYSNRPPFWYTKASDIEMEIQVGDRAYFHYANLMPDLGINVYNHNFLGSEKINGVMWHYFRVKYETVFAVVRYEKLNDGYQDFSWDMEPDLEQQQLTETSEIMYIHRTKEPKPWAENIYHKKVVMIGSYVFIKADKETWEDISIPTPETINGRVMLDQHSRPVMKPKEQWLVKKPTPENHYLSGWVAYVGSPLKGEHRHRHVHPGMYVYFRRYTDTTIMFEGEEYWRLRQNYIGMINPGKSKHGQVPRLESVGQQPGA